MEVDSPIQICLIVKLLIRRCDERKLVLHNLCHEPLKILHIVSLRFRQRSPAVLKLLLRLRHVKEQCRDDITPVIKQVFIVLRHVHQLVNDVQLQIELAAIDSVLRRMMEVELNTSHSHMVVRFHLSHFFGQSQPLDPLVLGLLVQVVK